MIGVDAPEATANKGLPLESQEELKMGQEAAEFVKNLTKGTTVVRDGKEIRNEGLKGKIVRLEFDVLKRDEQGRLLAYVYDAETYKGFGEILSPIGYEIVGDEIFINATIIKSGYATPKTISPNVTAKQSPEDAAKQHPEGKYADLFKRLYEEAREEGRGLWQKKETAKGKNTFKEFLNEPSGSLEEPKGILKYIDSNGVKLDTEF